MEQLNSSGMSDLECNFATVGDDCIFCFGYVSLSVILASVFLSLWRIEYCGTSKQRFHHRVQPTRLRVCNSLVCLCFTNRRGRGLDSFFLLSLLY